MLVLAHRHDPVGALQLGRIRVGAGIWPQGRLRVIGVIENAILAALRTASDAGVLGYKYASLETYPADWDVYLKENLGLIKAPAAWVVYRGWRNISVNAHDPLYEMNFFLVAMAENQRNDMATRHGDPVNPAIPGSFQMIWDAAALLSGRNFGDNIGAITVGVNKFVEAPAAFKDRKISMMAIELRTVVFGKSIFDAYPDITDFSGVHIDWDVPPFGGIDAAPGTVGIQLPDPAHADASDDIDLETL